MSFLEGFLGGAAEAGAGLIASNIKASQQKEQAQYESELALERQKTIEALKIKAADEARVAKADRIKSQVAANAQADADKNFQIPGEAPTVQADGKPMPQEGIDAFNQGKGLIQAAMEKRKSDYVADPYNSALAAAQTGDGDFEKLATLKSNEGKASEAQLTKLMLGDQRTQTMAMIAAGHDQTRQLVAGMMAAAKKDAANKEDRVIVHQFLAQFDRKIATNESEIKSLRSSLKNAFGDEADEIKKQISELQTANKNLTSAQMEYAKESGVKVPESVGGPSNKSDKPPAQNTPPGMTPIGTTKDGKTVYRGKDGKNYVQ